MDYSNIKKIVVAPQIVIYRNILSNSKNIIETLKDDSSDSMFSNWRSWYENGYRKELKFERNVSIKDSDPERKKQEHLMLNEVCEALDFIQKDYLDDFADEKGIWPSYIKDWDKLKEKMTAPWFDYFRYDVKLALQPEGTTNLYDKTMMFYHVDEFVLPNQFKPKRLVATINFYLNNEYGGGDICAYDSISNKSYRYKPQPGDAVIMPSTSPFYHSVKSYDGADRYFLRSFFEYQTNESQDNVYDFNELHAIEKEFIDKNLQNISVNTTEVVVDGNA